ncbi:MAG: hypothetical protein ABJ084_16545 [Halioglobus sp.]
MISSSTAVDAGWLSAVEQRAFFAAATTYPAEACFVLGYEGVAGSAENAVVVYALSVLLQAQNYINPTG